VTYEIDYKPTRKQRMFHASRADEVLYGGAAGGGKSKACVMDAFMRCMRWPGSQAYLFRRTYPELRDTLIGEALSSIPSGLGRYNSSAHDYALPNGSALHFRSCPRPADVYKYQGAQIHWLYMDELTHFEQGVYDYLRTRVRAVKSLNIVPVVRATSNPGGAGHSWVKAYFVDAAPPGEMREKHVFSRQLGKEQVRTVQYIPALAIDNPYLSEDYIYELEQKPEKLRRALLEGNWDAFEGQVFTEFTDEPEHYGDRRRTHVIDPFEIPAHWRRYRSFDFGYSRPFSVGWWAVDEDGVLYRYRELYGCPPGHANEGVRWTPREIAARIRDMERAAGEARVMGIADPSIFDASRGESVAEQMSAEGVYFEPGDNERLAGKMQVHYRMAFDAGGYPQMYVFSTCREFIRTIPALSYDEMHVEDIDTDGEDHIYDETRYMCMARPIKARAPVAKPKGLITRLGERPFDEGTPRRNMGW
jgi:hypothetical protein